MPDVQRQTLVPREIRSVWRFVADVNQWAADMPGYRSHTMLSERDSLWRITGDVGMLSREVEIRVAVTEWNEPRTVSFSLEGTEEPISGGGRFSTEATNSTETRLSFELSLAAHGAMAAVINVLLGTQLGRIADEFVSALTTHLLASTTTEQTPSY